MTRKKLVSPRTSNLGERFANKPISETGFGGRRINLAGGATCTERRQPTCHNLRILSRSAQVVVAAAAAVAVADRPCQVSGDAAVALALEFEFAADKLSRYLFG